MDEMTRKQLEEIGIDVKDAVSRFMENTEAYLGFLKKFPGDPNYIKLEEAVANNNPAQAMQAIHVLKGLCQNLSILPLYQLLGQQMKCFQMKNWQGVVDLMPQVRREYGIVAEVFRGLK